MVGFVRKNQDILEAIEERLQSAGEWVTVASEHADVAVDLARKSRFPKQALYHTQQSMEDATKGISRAAGVSHDELREHSHNYPYLFFLLLDTIITDSDGIQYANELLSPYYANQKGYDVKTHLGDMLNLTSSPRNKKLTKPQREAAERFFDALLRFPPEGVEVMLKQLAELNKKLQQTLSKEGPIDQFTKEPFVVKPKRTDGSFMQSVYLQLLEQARKRPGGRNLSNTEKAMLQRMARQSETNLLAQYGKEQIWEWLDAQGGSLSVNANEINPGLNRFLDMQSVLAGILILGSLVWPHESYPRYPAPPNAPDSLDEAAKRTGRWRSMGTKHYTQELGVIKHINLLTVQAKKTTVLLKKCYDDGYMLAAFPNDS
jgi:hypothetical protein